MTLTFSRAAAALALLLVALPALAQSPVGTWRTIDEETNQPKSIVRVFERAGTLHGEIVRLLPEGRLCVDCAARFNGQNLRGTEILSGFRRNGTTWEGGRITDPKSGRTYRAKMQVQSDGRLKVWGYVGLDTALTRRVQYWVRER
ncbi:MAG TPA: DUF2147 domain-containing protein [Rubricoccaceae bacterium]|jgi:uncharacterized protein (DUF2147 family)